MKQKKGSVNSKAGQWNSPNQSREKEKEWEKSEDNLWDNIKWTNIHIIGLPEEEREKGEEILFE